MDQQLNSHTSEAGEIMSNTIYNYAQKLCRMLASDPIDLWDFSEEWEKFK